MTQKLQRHKDTRTLPNSPTPTISATLKKHKHTQREAPRTRSIKSPVKAQTRRKSRSPPNGDAQRPLDHCSEVKELVAPDPDSARAPPRAWSEDAPADRNRTAGAAVASTQQQLRLFKMDTMGVDCHPCASKQVQNVRFARRDQGLGRADRRGKTSSELSSWCKVRSGVRGMCAHERRTVKSRCFASSCEEVPTENSICGSSLGTFSFA